MEPQTVLDNVAVVAQAFAKDRRARQMRRHLEPVDFEALAGAGFLLTGVPESMGGLWRDLPSSIRPISEILRTISRGDPSVALVSAMHPAVLAFWLGTPNAPSEHAEAWRAQTALVCQQALDGLWWGTITSEPGSGGDIMRSKAVAARDGEGYRLSGQKHFGSGSGNSSFVITTGIPEGETAADFFYLDVRDAPWDGSTGMRLVAEWDGHGMIATQSHAFEFSGYPATRLAWPNATRAVSNVLSTSAAAFFSAVIVGVVQSAVEAARVQVLRRKDDLRPVEQVEWVRVENEAWLIDQAYEGLLRAIEARGAGAGLSTLHGKTAIAELAESATQRICRVIGGGSFHRSSPYGAAFEDVRALGFLRPPWVLAFDQILDRTWQQYGST